MGTTWHEHLKPLIIRKLETLENESTACPTAFWLQYHRLLHPALTSPEQVWEFLYPGGAQPIEWVRYEDDECEHCEAYDVVFDARLDDWVCSHCGIIQANERKPFKLVVPESSIYKHHVHLHQILHELQCLRHALPDNIVDDVREFLGYDFSYVRIKKSLRRLGYKQHYNMVPSLQLKLDPTFHPLTLTREQEEVLMGYFNQYIALGKLEGKKNRLNYHFVLYKLCEMVGYDWVLPYLRPPKGKKSILEHERLWKGIAQRLNWSSSIRRPNPGHTDK